ncbi:MAG: DUF4118 domain-containing protein [Candidatus Kuenenia sp.]|nr:DUF4118 domain-containing protein [Candidatus Kuenenia hertensis]
MDISRWDPLFEVASATGTVGLSAGITRDDLEPLLKGILVLVCWQKDLEIPALLVVLCPGTWFGRRGVNLSLTKQNKIVPYFMSIAFMAATTFLGCLIRGAIEPTNIVIFYLLMVVMTAVWWGKYPAIMTSLMSVLAFDYFFVPPYLTFAVSDVQYVFTFMGLLVVGLVVSALASKTRQQAIEALEREEQTAILYRLSKDLAASDSLESVLRSIRMNVRKIFDCRVAIFLPADHGISPGSFDPDFPIDEHENTIAAWVFGNGKPAGWGSDTLPAAKVHYLPLKTSQSVLGVLGVLFKDGRAGFDHGGCNLLSALANQAAVAVQRAKLTEISRQMELIREREKLQTALLNSISHDLRTPLVSITGALSSLLQDSLSIDAEARKELLETAYEESCRLNLLVGNLLDMTRVEAGALKMKTKPCELRDVIGASLHLLKDKLEKRDIQIHIPRVLPEIFLDFTLMMRVFINLIDNAMKYSAPDTPIVITVKLLGYKVKIEVKDKGFGIPEEDLERIFDRFYRAMKPRQIAGTGLGLSICKGIIEAHGGKIFAENNPDKGVTLTVILPLEVKEA